MARWMQTSLIVVSLGWLVGCQTVDQERAAQMEDAAAARSEITGSAAPAFMLKNQDGDPVSLADFRGKWLVLYFYPKDDTPGCTCQANEFTELLQEFRDMNAEVVGVSADPPEHHRIFIRKYDLALTLLSDPEHHVMERYGAWSRTLFGERKYGRVTRSSFIIDPRGIVRYHCPEVIPLGHAERLRRKLAELQKAG